MGGTLNLRKHNSLSAHLWLSILGATLQAENKEIKENGLPVSLTKRFGFFLWEVQNRSTFYYSHLCVGRALFLDAEELRDLGHTFSIH